MKRRIPSLVAALAALPVAVLPVAAPASAAHAAPDRPVQAAPARPAAAAPEERPVIAVLVGFTDKRFADPAAERAKARDAFFGSGSSVATYFKTVSGGRVTFPSARGRVVGPWNLDMPASCDHKRMASLVEARMKAQGLDPARYRHVSILFPAGGCGWAGLATVNGRTSWMPKGYSTAGLIHEIGHNLGLGHEATRACPTGKLTGCADAGYRGKTSVMGGGGPHVGLSAPALVRLGWHTAAERVVPTRTGTHEITPLYGAGRRFLDIAIPGSADRLVVEYRRRGQAPDVDVAQGVIAYLVPGGKYEKALQIDPTPETTEKGSTALPWGGAFRDRGITVKVLGWDAKGARVWVKLPTS
ncbi:hypothetical protein [Bailinhaonella thermotolerans]|uniref:Peptidase M11 gametolysin domain-containing protein n=1 Tax=Bailinhaonella thermotolerans TaxID=1070861 RepID=A0A3A4A8X4_9ACTN|nr:hypothetical protein [Bailinhaonella thermotolerans]RJL24459.1 hypothetical protein D5H75_29495 [Bailinhaonella thermotolerans]